MIKIWWGISWRILAIWIVFVIPLGLTYLIIYNMVDAIKLNIADAIKLKPTISYMCLTILMLILGRSKKLNQFFWSGILDADSANFASNSIAALSLLSALLNFFVAPTALPNQFAVAPVAVAVAVSVVAKRETVLRAMAVDDGVTVPEPIVPFGGLPL